MQDLVSAVANISLNEDKLHIQMARRIIARSSEGRGITLRAGAIETDGGAGEGAHRGVLRSGVTKLSCSAPVVRAFFELLASGPGLSAAVSPATCSATPPAVRRTACLETGRERVAPSARTA